jgi:Fe-S-cluster containining protein
VTKGRKPLVKKGSRKGEYRCLRQCGKCCAGSLAVPISAAEYKMGKYKIVPNSGMYLSALGGEVGLLDRLFAACELHYQLATKLNGSCFYIKDGACSIYKDRPRVCRGYLCATRTAEWLRLESSRKREKRARA